MISIWCYDLVLIELSSGFSYISENTILGII